MGVKRLSIGKSGEVNVEFERSAEFEVVDSLALEAVEECRKQLMMALRFLNPALWHMPLAAAPLSRTFATDGRVLRYDPERVVERFRGDANELVRDLLHVLLHCVFHQPMERRFPEHEAWSLACDIVAELCAIDLGGARFPSAGDRARLDAAGALGGVAAGTAGAAGGAGRKLTAPALYRVFRSGQGGEALYVDHGFSRGDLHELARLFRRDLHDGWATFPREDEQANPAAGAPEAVPDLMAKRGDEMQVNAGSAGASSDADGGGSGGDGTQAGANAGDATADASANAEAKADGTPAVGSADANAGDAQEDAGREDTANGGGDEDREAAPGDGARADDGRSTEPDAGFDDGGADEADAHLPTDADLDERTSNAAGTPTDDIDDVLADWQRISKRVETEMRTSARSRTAGTGAGHMLTNLAVANRRPADYDSFLRRFATMGEDMRISDEEFDYVFYTFGMQRYGNIPLVEPLEYRESRRVREFVLALDTSGSCSGELLRTFVQRSYDILRQQSSFGDEINVHIVQCDAKVRSATKIESLRQLEEFSQTFWVSGGGGTDFRPVFEYVDALVDRGEFRDLRGMVYFTDGYGTFPAKAPDYDVAFVFVDTDGEDVRVPPWAMKVLMTQDEVMER